jgi:tRNA (guanine37-N1)-methyltransferase
MALHLITVFPDGMRYAKVAAKHAEKTRRLLRRMRLLDSSMPAEHSLGCVYFPVVDAARKNKKLTDSVQIVAMNPARGESASLTYAERLDRLLNKKELPLLEHGYEQLGNIAIIGSKLKRAKEKLVALALMQTNKSIKTVLAKAGPISGEYRTRKLRYVAGVRSYEALYRENNCVFKFDVRKVYFSSKLSYERARIVSRVRDRENVMVMFAGVGPFAIEIAKAHPKTHVVAIEINRHGYESMLENIRLNKTQNVKAVLGDVHRVYGKYKGFADRVIMPLPMSSLQFLDEACAVSKKSAIIDIYSFGTIGTAFEEIWKAIRKHASANNYRVRLIGKREVRQYSSTEVEMGIEHRIMK